MKYLYRDMERGGEHWCKELNGLKFGNAFSHVTFDQNLTPIKPVLKVNFLEKKIVENRANITIYYLLSL